MRYCVVVFLCLLLLELNAQELRVIDNKGTLQNINNNKVTTAAAEPSSPVEGDVWFDTTTNISKIYDGSLWKEIDPDKVTTSATAPVIPVEGDVWFDTTNNLTKIFDGSLWKPLFQNNDWKILGNSRGSQSGSIKNVKPT